MSTVNSLYHIVINTHKREMVINEEHKRDLYKYIWNICVRHNCQLYRINGIGNHIHMLVELHPSMALSDFVKHVKQASSIWMQRSDLFPEFQSWGKEYFAFSVSRTHAEAVKQYIINQEDHHSDHTFEGEMQDISRAELKEWGDYLLT